MLEQDTEICQQSSLTRLQTDALRSLTKLQYKVLRPISDHTYTFSVSSTTLLFFPS